MGMPRSPAARLYYRAAKQRFEESELLLSFGFTTGAVYLAGYTVECMLKALVLASVLPALRRELLADFRGKRGHNVEWLGALYRRHVTSSIPRDINRHLSRLAEWSTDLRYATERMNPNDAEEFVLSVKVVTTWAEGRM
jgi:HEPN domain-containing protein